MEVRVKTLRAFSVATFLLSTILSSATAQTIAAAEAKNHLGEKTTVCGKVANEYTAENSRGKPTFIDLDSAYPNRTFTIVIWDSDRQAVGDLPRIGLRICATGLIKDYRGNPQIAVWSKDQFRW
jgi:DNA/RNA endonuclease YhcR with UshA esterase domain